MLKNKGLIILVLSISLIFLYGCATRPIEDNDLNNNETARLPIEYTYDFQDGLGGWLGGFAGVPKNYMNDGYNTMFDYGDYNLLNGTDRGIYLTGNNLRDDMFMYTTRKFDRSDGLRPNTNYVVDFKFDLVSNIPSSRRGITNNAIWNTDTNRDNVDFRDNNPNDLTREDNTRDRNNLDLGNNNRNDLTRNDTYTRDRNNLDLGDNNRNDLTKNDTYTRDRNNLDLGDNNRNDLTRNDTYTRDRNNLDLRDNDVNTLDRDTYTTDRNDFDLDNDDTNTIDNGTYTTDRGVNTIVGERVYVKAGVVNVEPKADLTEQADGGFYNMNLDKGTLSDGGRDMITLGNAAIDDLNDNSVYNQKSFQRTFNATTNENGELWVIVGIDSDNNGTSKLYLDNVAINIDER